MILPKIFVAAAIVLCFLGELIDNEWVVGLGWVLAATVIFMVLE